MNLALQPPAIEIKATKPERQQIGSAIMEQDGTTILRKGLVDVGLVGEMAGRIKSGSPKCDKVRRHLPEMTTGHNVPIHNDRGF